MTMVAGGEREHELVLQLDGEKYLVLQPGRPTYEGGPARQWQAAHIGDQDAPIAEELTIRDDFFSEGAGFTFEGIDGTYEIARAWDASAPGKVGTWPPFASGESAVSPDARGWIVYHEGIMYVFRGRYGAKYALDQLQFGETLTKVGTDKDFGSGKAVAGRPVSFNGQIAIPVLDTATGALEKMVLLTAVGSPDTYGTVDAGVKGRCFTVWNGKLVMAESGNTIRTLAIGADATGAANWAPDYAGSGYAMGPVGSVIHELLVYHSYLIAWTDLGPYYCDEDLQYRPGIPELANERDTLNGYGAAVANAAILAPSRGGLTRWVPDGQWARVGPEMEGGLEGDKTPGWGRVSGIVSYGGLTFVVSNDVNGVASLWSFQPPRSKRAPYAVHCHQQEEGAQYEDVAVVLASAQPLQNYAFGTISDDSAVGTISWSNPSNAGAADGSYASALAGTSHYLKLLNPNPGLPADATLVGVELIVKRSVGPAS